MVARNSASPFQVTHARSGGNIEVMGLMQGKVNGDTMIVMDAFALPVEGTETRVSAQDQAYEYMVAYMEKIKEVGVAKHEMANCAGVCLIDHGFAVV